MWLIGKASDFRSMWCRFDPRLQHFEIIYTGDIRYHRSWTVQRMMKHRRAGGKLRCHRKCSMYRMLSYWKNPLLSELSSDVDGLPTEMFDFIESFHCSWCIVQNINVTDNEHLFHWPERLVLCHPVMLTEELTGLVTVYAINQIFGSSSFWTLHKN